MIMSRRVSELSLIAEYGESGSVGLTACAFCSHREFVQTAPTASFHFWFPFCVLLCLNASPSFIAIAKESQNGMLYVVSVCKKISQRQYVISDSDFGVMRFPKNR